MRALTSSAVRGERGKIEKLRVPRFGRIATALGLSFAFVSARASAETSPTDSAVSEALFREAKALLVAGEIAKACPKLAESYRLDPGTGTLLLLAHCHEREGKIASAWAEYSDALAQARAAGRADRVTVAKDAVDRLEPELPKLTLRVNAATASIAGVVVLLDDHDVGGAAWGTSIPIDPGEHRIDVRAKGYRPWRHALTVRGARQKLSVSVPALEREPLEVAPVRASESVPPSPEKEGGSAWPAVGWGGVGVGGAALATAGYFSVRALSAWNDVRRRCPSSPCTDRAAEESLNGARSAANTATWFYVGGGVAAAAGLVLVLTTRGHAGSPPQKVSASIVPVQGGLGLTAEGSF